MIKCKVPHPDVCWDVRMNQGLKLWVSCVQWVSCTQHCVSCKCCWVSC